MLHSAWIAIISALLTFLGGSLSTWKSYQTFQTIQSEPSWIAFKVDSIWKEWTESLYFEIQNSLKQLNSQFELANKTLPPKTLEVPVLGAEQMSLSGRYGKLPEIYTDRERGAIFPKPISIPSQYSWLQTAQREKQLLTAITRLESKLSDFKNRRTNLSSTDAIRQLGTIGKELEELSSQAVSIGEDIRYLHLWIQNLQDRRSFEAGKALSQAFSRKTPEIFEILREQLKPRRLSTPSYLPKNMSQVTTKDRVREMVLPIATDIADPRIIREFEGALETHWNSSRWAREQGIRFRIQWSQIARDEAFARAKISLEEHLKRFTPDKAGLTTGGLLTHVRGNVLVLGTEGAEGNSPGSSRIRPRTLAHELGHLMGFGDCYLRTLSGVGPGGLLGLAVLEWDNPIYPDDLMCDDQLGTPRVEIW